MSEMKDEILKGSMPTNLEASGGMTGAPGSVPPGAQRRHP